MRAATDEPPKPASADAVVIALIGAAHFISHFTILAIPPLFPMIREDLGVSYATLGGAVALLSAVTASGRRRSASGSTEPARRRGSPAAPR